MARPTKKTYLIVLAAFVVICGVGGYLAANWRSLAAGYYLRRAADPKADGATIRDALWRAAQYDRARFVRFMEREMERLAAAGWPSDYPPRNRDSRLEAQLDEETGEIRLRLTVRNGSERRIKREPPLVGSGPEVFSRCLDWDEWSKFHRESTMKNFRPILVQSIRAPTPPRVFEPAAVWECNLMRNCAMEEGFNLFQFEWWWWEGPMDTNWLVLCVIPGPEGREELVLAWPRFEGVSGGVVRRARSGAARTHEEARRRWEEMHLGP